MNLLQTLPTVGALVDVLQTFVFILFVVCGVVMSVVILLQEGKGGGLGGAFGGAAAETFGVKAGTISRFTSYLAASFLLLALLYAGLAASGERESMTLPTNPPLEDVPVDAVGTTDPVPAEEVPAEEVPAEEVPAEEEPAEEPAKPVEAPAEDAPKPGE